MSQTELFAYHKVFWQDRVSRKNFLGNTYGKLYNKINYKFYYWFVTTDTLVIPQTNTQNLTTKKQ